ncbi:unnamed protein product, partial [marine sediment metagenome]
MPNKIQGLISLKKNIDKLQADFNFIKNEKNEKNAVEYKMDAVEYKMDIVTAEWIDSDNILSDSIVKGIPIYDGNDNHIITCFSGPKGSIVKRQENAEETKRLWNDPTVFHKERDYAYKLDPDDPYIIYFPPLINLDDVIGAYYVIDTSNINVGGIAFSGDSDTFVDANDDPITVFRVDYVGVSPQTPSNQYYIEHIEPFEILSNRDYDIHLKIYDPG